MNRALFAAVLAFTVAACAIRPTTSGRETGPRVSAQEGTGATNTGATNTGANNAGAESAPSAAFVPGSTATAGAALPANEAMVQTARSMVGVPYSFGGTEPDGFDCSGLVVYAANSVGISLPRTAREQMTKGIPVARDQLLPGDLVFMRLKRRQLHVGIAVDATHFIHAPSRGGRVRIDSLDAKPYSRAYQSARRIISAEIVTSP